LSLRIDLLLLNEQAQQALHSQRFMGHRLDEAQIEQTVERSGSLHRRDRRRGELEGHQQQRTWDRLAGCEAGCTGEQQPGSVIICIDWV
jgi:hypothetical protein